MPTYHLPPVPVFYEIHEKKPEPFKPWVIIPRAMPVNENACPSCGLVFEPGKAYGYVCPNNMCPIQPKAI